MENNQVSQIITEQVPVRSSELVAELVGRKGQKIRVLQEKTNTYINVPARDESHVFTIAGRPQDVAAAKYVLLLDAIHLTRIRAPQTNCIHNLSTQCSGLPYGPFAEENPTLMPQSGYITQYVPVHSSDLVAQMIGTNGCRINPLRERTNAYIRCPKPDEDPTFEITGRPDDVTTAKHQVAIAAEYIRHGDPIFAITGKPEDVAEAKREVLSAAEYVTHIPAPPETIDTPNRCRQWYGSHEQEPITIYVCIPPRAVPYVVGYKGTRIRGIQERTNTCIVSPYKKKAIPKATGKREIDERSKRGIDSIVAKSTEGSVTDHLHSASGDISPRSHCCELSDATQVRMQ